MAIVLDGTAGITTPDLTDTSLTSGRVVSAGTSGNLTGSSAFTFDGSTLALTGVQQITNSGGSTLILDRTSNAGSLQLNYNGTQTGQVQAASGGGLIFYQGSTPTEGMRLTSTGLGIGTSSPSTILDIGAGNSTPKTITLRYSSVPTYLSSTYDGSFGLSTFSINSYNVSNGSASWSSFGNTGYTSSAIQLASDTNGSQIRFLTASAVNTAPTERARIDSAGRVTMPYQSGFAYGSSEVTVVGSNYILFSGGSYNYNVGSILNLTGGTSGASRVTVPVSGYYSVNVSIMGSTDGTRIEMFVTKNGTNIFGTNSISSQYNNAQINGVFYFAANDYLEIYKQAGSIYGSNSPNNFFTVRLLG